MSTYVINVDELIGYAKESARPYTGAAIDYCNLLPFIESLVEERYYGNLYMHHPRDLLQNYNMPSEIIEQVVGYVRLELNRELDVVLANVPKDHWIDYRLNPNGDIYLAVQVPVPTHMTPFAAYWDYVEDIRRRVEAGEPDPVLQQHRLAIVKDISDGGFIPNDIRKVAGL